MGEPLWNNRDALQHFIGVCAYKAEWTPFARIGAGAATEFDD